MTNVDWNTLSTVVGTLGGFAVIGKWLVRSAEKANETLPVILENLKNLNLSVKELFESRNRHEVLIAETNKGIECCEYCQSHKHKRSTD